MSKCFVNVPKMKRPWSTERIPASFSQFLFSFSTLSQEQDLPWPRRRCTQQSNFLYSPKPKSFAFGISKNLKFEQCRVHFKIGQIEKFLGITKKQDEYQIMVDKWLFCQEIWDLWKCPVSWKKLCSVQRKICETTQQWFVKNFSDQVLTYTAQSSRSKAFFNDEHI